MYFVGVPTPAANPKSQGGSRDPASNGVVGITVPYFARVGFRV